jgi:hypothetical protein
VEKDYRYGRGQFNALTMKSSISGGFQGASLVLLNLEVVISQLNVQLRTPTLPTIKDSYYNEYIYYPTRSLPIRLTALGWQIKFGVPDARLGLG